jgi:hypothetical protein
MKNQYDIIIIGSGMAGLYSAYQIKKQSPKTSFLILEKYKKQWVGGRTSNDDFYGVKIVTGAGIGREDTNPLLIQLMKELHVPFEKTVSVMDFAKTIQHPVNVKKVIDLLKKEYKKHPEQRSLTFKEFTEPILGSKLYHDFIVSSGYSDYENADIYETLYKYGFDDNQGGWTMLFISWKKLVLALMDKIGSEHFKFSQNVIKIAQSNNNTEPCLFEIMTEKNTIYYAAKVIVATTITSIQKLIPGASLPSSPYQQIHGQIFLRLYGKFNKESAELMKKVVPHYTIVPGPLQKLIPIDEEKGVYMIAYSDNQSAKYLKQFLENTPKNRDFLCRLIEKSLGLPDGSLYLIAIKDYYWPVGTHYYEPLKGFPSREEFVQIIQHPMKNMLVVGEAVSRYQGWVEGALESVKSVLTKQWIQSKNVLC